VRSPTLCLCAFEQLLTTETVLVNGAINFEFRSLAVDCKDVLSVLLRGEVLPPRGIGSQVPSSRKRCIPLIAELTPSRGKAKRLIITADSGAHRWQLIPCQSVMVMLSPNLVTDLLGSVRSVLRREWR
jgi:hypothetical protein